MSDLSAARRLGSTHIRKCIEWIISYVLYSRLVVVIIIIKEQHDGDEYRTGNILDSSPSALPRVGLDLK